MDKSSFGSSIRPSLNGVSSQLAGLMGSSSFSGGSRPGAYDIGGRSPFATGGRPSYGMSSGIGSQSFGRPSLSPPSFQYTGGSALAAMGLGSAPGATSTAQQYGARLSANNPTQYDRFFEQAAAEMSSKYGVQLSPALLKAMGHIESGGTFDNTLARDDGFGDGLSVGIMQVKPNIWGSLVPDADPSDPLGNIRLGAAIMAKSIAEYGSWEAALTNVYFPVDDPNGTTQSMYVDTARNYMNQYAGSMGSTDPNQQLRDNYNGSGNVSGVLGIAKQYLGTPYVWGGIPGKGETPTGWDCSGFMYWLDQNYGDGSLPMGSHYQYQKALDTGNVVGANELQAGDLVFFDTGNRAGGGAELNAAGHVGMYLGDGTFIHAANPEVGTIVSNLSEYMNMYGFLGGMRMSWSGGGAGVTGNTTGTNPTSSVGAPTNPWASRFARYGAKRYQAPSIGFLPGRSGAYGGGGGRPPLMI